MAYSAKADVRRYLPRSVVMQGENPTPHPRDPRPESLLDTDTTAYRAQADSIINGRISAIYDVPLKKSNIGGTVGYPHPIPFISAVFAAWMIFQQRLSGSERAISDYTERMYGVATQQLDNIENGNIRLRGQDSYTSSRTVKSDLWSIPPRPGTQPANTAAGR